MLHDLKAALTNGTSADIANLSGKILTNLDNAIDNTLNLRAEVGAKSNRLQMALNQSAAETLNYKELKSKLNDVDMVKAITEFKMQESVYQAALNTGAQIIQPSLLNFLK
jgi:flagellar hook-associated protein 3 FlgL